MTRGLESEGQPRLLRDIPRPKHIEQLVPIDYSLLIDDRVILNFNNARNRFMVGREMTIPVLYANGDNTPMFVFPNPNAALLEGRFSTLPVEISGARRGIYIGEDYKVTYLDKSKAGHLLKVESTSPFKSELLRGVTMPSEFLTQMHGYRKR